MPMTTFTSWLKRSCILIVVLMCAIPTLWGQVQNGTLDSVIFIAPGCVLDGDGLNLPKRIVPGWSMPTGGSSDYFNSCQHTVGDDMGVPYNMFAGNSLGTGLEDGATAPGWLGNTGYLGIYAGRYRRTEGAVTGVMEYREYVMNALLTPLDSGRTYRIHFRISPALGGRDSGDCVWGKQQWNPHAWKNIGVVLSAAPIAEATAGVLTTPAGINVQKLNISSEDGDPSRPFWYEAGPPNWIDVETDVKINGSDKNYVTIGNIDPTLNGVNTFPINNFNQDTNSVFIYSYYFIDGLEITDVTPPTPPEPCTGCNLMTVSSVRKSTATEGKCCYLITVKNNSECDIEQVVLKQHTPGHDSTLLDSLALPILPDSQRVFEMCVDEFTVSDGQPGIDEVEWTVNLKTTGGTTCTKHIRVSCNCPCPSIQDTTSISYNGFAMHVLGDSSTPGKCCWTISFSNKRVCKFNQLNGIMIYTDYHADSTGLRAVGLGSFDTATYARDDSNMTIRIPATSAVTIGSNGTVEALQLCLDAGSPDVNIVVGFITSGIESPGTMGCIRDFKAKLSCAGEPVNCCNDIHVVERSIGTLAIPCCKTFAVGQASSAACKVYKVTLQPPMPSPASIILNGGSNPLTLGPWPQITQLTTICTSTSGTYTFSFLGKTGNVICTKSVSMPSCSGGGGCCSPASKSRVDSSSTNTGVTSSAKPQMAVLYDLQGRAVLIVDRTSDIDMVHSIIYEAGLSSGAYMLRIEYEDSTSNVTKIIVP